MAKHVMLVLMAGMALSLTAQAAVGEELAAVEKKICASWEKHKSMTGKMTMEMQMEQGSMVMESKGEGTHEIMRKGEQVLSRTEMKNTMVQKMGEQEMKMSQEVTIIVDGEFAYTLSVQDMMGQQTKMAVKSDIDPQMSGDPKALFEQLAKDNELKLLPEETVDGKKVYVIAATPKERPAAPGAPSKTVFHFDQQDGYMVKMVTYTAEDKPLTTVSYSDVKLGVDLQPSRFVFEAPEGVQVIDQTGQKP